MPLEYRIAPSILSGDFGQLASECAKLVEAGADWLHVDIMDGHFVPNLTIGPPVVKALRQHTEAFLDCHCMVRDPEAWMIESLARAGASQVTFHWEATKDVSATIDLIRRHQLRVGLAIKPDTPIDCVLPYLSRLHMLLVMTVEPGFGGQTLISQCLEKVRVVRQHDAAIDVQVDGGVTVENLPAVIGAGANVIVAGTLIFGAPSMADMISQMKGIIHEHQMRL